MVAKWARFEDLNVKSKKRLRRFISCVGAHDYLIHYMEEHPNIAKKQITNLGVQGKDTYRFKWIELDNDLNVITNCEKNVDYWQSQWDTIRLKAKNEMTVYLKDLQNTGNIATTEPSETCQRICNIFGRYGVSIPVLPEIELTTSIDKDEKLFHEYFQKLSKKGMKFL